MGYKGGVSFSRHACDQFLKTSEALGLETSIAEMERVFQKAVPEKGVSPSTQFNLFKRRLLHGKTKYYVADGWRFAVAGNKVVTAERVKPHENHKYFRNFYPGALYPGERR